MGVVMVYSSNNRESFENLNKWLQQVEQYAPINVCKVLLANKEDIGDKKVDPSEGRKFAENNAMKFF